MKMTGTIGLAVLFAAAVPAQDERGPQKKARAKPALERKRDGGFHGIWFRETRHDGKGALKIREVLAGSDAARLGYRAGDLIVAVDGQSFRDGDQFIQQLYMTVPQFRRQMGRGRSGKADAARAETPAKSFVTVVRGGERMRIEGGLLDLDASPKVGDAAPDFTLKTADGKRQVSLAKLLGTKPVVLVFGSYT